MTDRIERLIGEMTLEEKIGQLNQVGPSPMGGIEVSPEELKRMLEDGRITPEQYRESVGNAWRDTQEDEIRAGRIGSFLCVVGAERCNRLQKIAVEESRLKIPLLFGQDVIHGQHTIFPIPLAESCSWDEALWERSAEIAAKEAAADGIRWTFAPMLDIARDARWGRIAESPGEDPCLASRYAEAKVRGFQGDGRPDGQHVAACAKHFVAYGACAGGRDYDTVDMSLQTLYEIYLPPFAAAVRAGVKTVMSAFNDFNGVPCAANPYLLKDVLRDQLGFRGMIVSDANAVYECIPHGVAADGADAAANTLLAGLNMDMGSHLFVRHLTACVKEGRVPLSAVDEAVRRVLLLKAELGLFDSPYTAETKAVYPSPEHRAAARDAARKSAVLLKNDGVLPLRAGRRVTLIGALAERPDELLGTWNILGKGEEAVSIADGLRGAGVPFDYFPCCSPEGAWNEEEIERVCRSETETVIAVVGEPQKNSGEAASFCRLALPGRQEEAVLRLAEAGKRVIALVCTGRPPEIPQIAAHASAVLLLWHGGTEAGNAAADLITGKYNPSGRLTVTLPHYTGENPAYYNHPNTGRPRSEERFSARYADAPYRPLYPFGFGLSYTEYRYEGLAVQAEKGRFTASVRVKNVGSVAGEETVQLYTRDPVAQRVRPVRELKAFQKIFLLPGEEKTVRFSVPYEALAFYGADMKKDRAIGEISVMVGHDSDHWEQKSLQLTEALL